MIEMMRDEGLLCVYSVSRRLAFNEKLPGNHLSRCLGDWLEGISDWLEKNGFVVGHLKILVAAEGEMDRLSITKGYVSRNPSPEWPDTLVRALDLYVTLIAFGPDEDAFQREASRRMTSLCFDEMVQHMGAS